MLNEESKKYVENYIGRKLTSQELNSIQKHCKKYNTSSICAWYEDWEDFCSDWCSDDIGFTRSEARKLLHGGEGEFQKINTIGILRFEI